MFRFTLTSESTQVKPSKTIALYADPESWYLSMALFQRAGSKRPEYVGIKDLYFDWDLLECHKAEGAEAVNTGSAPTALLELHELIGSFIVLDNISIGTIRDAVIDQSSLHIDAFLVDYIENDSFRALFLESDWCSRSGDTEPHLKMKVPFDQVRSFLE